MKKIIFTILTLAAFSFTSCGSDDSNDEQNISVITEADLVDTWELTDYSSEDAISSTEISNEPFSSTFEYESSNHDYTITFNEDNTANTLGSFDLDVNITTFGETSTQNILFATDGQETGSWELIDGNTLLIEGNGNIDDGEYEIIEYTGSLIRLEADLSQTNDFVTTFVSIGYGGVGASISGRLIITLER